MSWVPRFYVLHDGDKKNAAEKSPPNTQNRLGNLLIWQEDDVMLTFTSHFQQIGQQQQQLLLRSSPLVARSIGDDLATHTRTHRWNKRQQQTRCWGFRHNILCCDADSYKDRNDIMIYSLPKYNKGILKKKWVLFIHNTNRWTTTRIVCVIVN